ncbi:MAG: uracil-DNA glycosylase [Clostridia bacterium]|nr:uracil-DNA glycosylase [Clostridia bacterium]MBQ2110168.1 uracil-DNA glycosylase [Clostridia bacterium]MBQ2191460.1 uracil-DNA glycosylase [Clostridia bacterium]MBQ3938131.1 uracil-DNA glycosylase [Clostridia bacterium]MBQ5488815.1 uracil-DNA glycosylase [Clostridia bacterium]
MIDLGNDWNDILADEFQKDYYLKLREFLKTEYRSARVYPGMYDIFNALRYTSFADVKAVILGQDPYHGPGQAHGLCFSVRPGVEPPPSLKNIYKELESDIGFVPPAHGCLTHWARQGVLLLNTVLTVREHEPNSHRGMGWEIFTDRVIKELDRKDKPVVFLLWGANARKKADIVQNPIHVKLTAPHPSPLSAYSGFFGCRHFSKANEILVRSGQKPINWQLPPEPEL